MAYDTADDEVLYTTVGWSFPSSDGKAQISVSIRRYKGAGAEPRVAMIRTAADGTPRKLGRLTSREAAQLGPILVEASGHPTMTAK